MSASHLGYLGSVPAPSSRLQLSAHADPGRRQWWLKWLGSCHPHGRSGLSSWLPGLAQPSPGQWGIWRMNLYCILFERDSKIGCGYLNQSLNNSTKQPLRNKLSLIPFSMNFLRYSLPFSFLALVNFHQWNSSPWCLNTCDICSKC